MDRRRILAIILLIIAILIIVSVPVWLLTPVGANVLGLGQPDLNGPPLTPLTFKVLPKTVPQAALTPTGQPGSLDASEAILMDDLTGNILYEKNAETPVPMASTTKIMTALIAIQTGHLNEMVTIGLDAPLEVSENDGSSANLVVGDKIKLEDLLYGLLLPSGDDAAVAIADAVAGSVPNFVNIMNVEAQRLGLFQTHYVNPDGLPPTDAQGNPIDGVHYSTAYDLVHLAKYAMSIPLFTQIVSQKEYSLPATATHHAYQWLTTNELLGTYKGMLGIKTGSTPEAGDCLVFAAQQNGHTLYGVVLHSTDDATRFQDAETLLNWGFKLPMQVPQV
jgi:serine-type D-Ala-D-Ala carboxypeptidase (penicillin-binding protein 5/6)